MRCNVKGYIKKPLKTAYSLLIRGIRKPHQVKLVEN